MRDAIAWSHDLLPPEEQLLFRRLAVFVGGFTLEAAEVVARVPREGGIAVLDGLASLVDKSLIREEDGPGDEPRYQMLETVREFGLDQLAASGNDVAVRDARAAHFLTLAEAALPQFDGPGILLWLDRIDADHDNLRAALAWAEERGAADTMARTAGPLWQFWMVRGHVSEGATSLVRTQVMFVDAQEITPVEAVVGAVAMTRLRGNQARATATAEELLTRSRAQGDCYGLF